MSKIAQKCQNLTGKILEGKIQKNSLILSGKWSSSAQQQEKFIFKLVPNTFEFSGY